MTNPDLIAAANKLLAFIRRSILATGNEPGPRECVDEMGGKLRFLMALHRLKDDGRYPIRRIA